MIRRREVITLLGGAMAAWPVAARAQIHRIGMLMGVEETDPQGQRWVQVFLEALNELGWINGKNIQIDLRWATRLDRMQAFAQN